MWDGPNIIVKNRNIKSKIIKTILAKYVNDELTEHIIIIDASDLEKIKDTFIKTARVKYVNGKLVQTSVLISVDDLEKIPLVKE